MSDYRKLLATPCWSCVIDIVGWREPENTEWPQRGWINIGLISNHDFQQFNSWRSKFRRIITVLHGETCPFLEFYRREDVDAFAVALRMLPMSCFRAINRCDRQLSQTSPKVTLGVEGQDAVS